MCFLACVCADGFGQYVFFLVYIIGVIMELKRVAGKESLEVIREVMMYNDWKPSGGERYLLAKVMKVPSEDQQMKFIINLDDLQGSDDPLTSVIVVYVELKTWLLNRQIYFRDAYYTLESRIQELIDIISHVTHHDVYGAVYIHKNPTNTNDQEFIFLKFDKETMEQIQCPGKQQTGWWT